MPLGKRKRTTKKFRRKPTFKRRKFYTATRRRNYRSSMIRSTLLPPSRVVRFRYVQKGQIDPPLAPNITLQVFRASAWDPDYTGVGGASAALWDQVTQFYEDFCTIGAKCRFTAVNWATGSGDHTYLMGAVRNEPALPGLNSVEQVVENGARLSIIAPSTSSASSKHTMTMKYSPKRVHKVANVKDKKVLHYTGSSNPTEDGYFVYGAAGHFDGSDNPLPLNWIVIIDYLVLCSDRKTIDRS